MQTPLGKITIQEDVYNNERLFKAKEQYDYFNIVNLLLNCQSCSKTKKKD